MLSEHLQARVVLPNNVEERIVLPTETKERLHKLQEIVGGQLEAIPLPCGQQMLMNADGKLQPHQINITATMIAFIHEAITADDYIAGPAVIVSTALLE